MTYHIPSYVCIMSADEDISNDRNVMIFTQCFSHTNALNILVGMSATAMFQ